jgi:hypothetical protein
MAQMTSEFPVVYVVYLCFLRTFLYHHSLTSTSLHASTTPQSPPHKHYLTSTSSQSPPHKYHLTSTTSQAPPHKHLLTITSSQVPPHKHHLTSTSSQAPPHNHLLTSTTSQAPPHKHLLTSTSSQAPCQQNHTCTSHFFRSSVLAGHFGQLLTSHEQPRGCYSVTMATLDCVHTVLNLESGIRDSSEILSCLMYLVEEVLPVYHKWRYSHNTDLDKMCECLW